LHGYLTGLAEKMPTDIIIIILYTYIILYIDILYHTSAVPSTFFAIFIQTRLNTFHPSFRIVDSHVDVVGSSADGICRCIYA